MRAIWNFVTDFGDTAITVPLAVLMACFLLAVGAWRRAIVWALTVIGCAGMTAGLKIMLAPCAQVAHIAPPTNPSGHTAISTLVYGGYAAVIGGGLPEPARACVFAAAGVLTVAIAVSRPILGVHSVLDVALGLVVGVVALAGLVWFFARQRAERVPVGWLIVVLLVPVVLFHGHRWPTEEVVRGIAGWFDAVKPWCG